MVDKKILEAAAQLEDLAIIAKQMVTDLREGADNPYGRVYWLRKQMGEIVASLGAGAPTARGLNEIEFHYERFVNRSDRF